MPQRVRFWITTQLPTHAALIASLVLTSSLQVMHHFKIIGFVTFNSAVGICTISSMVLGMTSLLVLGFVVLFGKHQTNKQKLLTFALTTTFLLYHIALFLFGPLLTTRVVLRVALIFCFWRSFLYS